MKIIAYSYVSGKTYHFESLEKAEEFTHISAQRILACVRTGNKWRMWTFDEDL